VTVDWGEEILMGASDGAVIPVISALRRTTQEWTDSGEGRPRALERDGGLERKDEIGGNMRVAAASFLVM
jgi:hypothetical protein